MGERVPLPLRPEEMAALGSPGERGRAPASRWPAASRFILVLLVFYALKQTFSVAAFYPFSGHDELAHFSYVRTIVTEGRLPELPDLATWRAGLTRGEPPATDEIPANLYSYCRFTLDWFCSPDSPRWRDEPPRVVTVPGFGYYPSGYLYVANHPPLYYLLMAPLYAVSMSLAPVDQHYLLRVAAIPFGLLTVYAAYRMARALFPGDAFLTVTVPAFVALQPQVSYEAAMVNNDIAAIALMSLLLWGIVVGIRDRFPLRLSLALGTLLGLGLLAKGTTITVVPVLAVALVISLGWREWRGLVGRALAIAMPAIVLAAPWYIFLYRTYGDFSGLRRVSELQYWNSPMGSFFELLLDPSFAGDRFKESWGEFGWRLIHLNMNLLWAIAIPLLAGFLGLVIFAIREWRGTAIWWGDVADRLSVWQWQALGILLFAFVVSYLAVVQFGTSFALSQARYFFPVVNAAALLLMTGLRTIVPARARPAGQGIVVTGLIALNLVIMTSYVLPFTMTVDEPVVTWSWGG
jgi:4-amino-4-deoxy-L-arabinose transferase-like glycosyltransferase